VAAINAIGQGEWSLNVGFYAASLPDNPLSFQKVSSSE